MLSECSSNSIGKHDCEHSEDAGVRCPHSKYDVISITLSSCQHAFLVIVSRARV